MEIFWRLLLGHLLADFTFQTNFISRWKRASLWGMLAHCAIHSVICAVLTWPYLGECWVSVGVLHLQGWVCILALGAAHFLEDQWRVMDVFKHQASDNTAHFVWDQVIHVALLFAVAPLGLSSSAGVLIPERWPVLACLAVFLTHAASVTEYFLERDLFASAAPDFDEKYLGMMERLVLGLCFLLPQNGWLLAAPLWLAAMCALRARRLLDLSWFSLAFGSAASISCGLLARLIYYS